MKPELRYNSLGLFLTLIVTAVFFAPGFQYEYNFFNDQFMFCPPLIVVVSVVFAIRFHYNMWKELKDEPD